MYKFKITVRIGCLGVRIWKGMCRFMKKLSNADQKNPLKTVNPPLILPAVRVLALFKVQVLSLKSRGLWCNDRGCFGLVPYMSPHKAHHNDSINGFKMINWKVHNERYTVRFVFMHASKSQLAFSLQVSW